LFSPQQRSLFTGEYWPPNAVARFCYILEVLTSRDNRHLWSFAA
jgi:hypothetical protein